MNNYVLDEEIICAVAKILIDRIKEKKTNKKTYLDDIKITYKELSYELKYKTDIYVHYRNFDGYLGDLSEIARGMGFPLLSAMVINKDSRCQDQDFFKTFAPGLDQAGWKDFHYKELRRILDEENWNGFLNQLWEYVGGLEDRDAVASSLEIEESEEKEEESIDLQEVAKAAKERFMAGESETHKSLKEFIAEHPEVIGLEEGFEAIIEYPFPSGDRADIVLEGPDKIAVVEIEVEGLNETVCGLFQVVKYKSLMEAIFILDGDDREVDGILVAGKIPSEVMDMAEELQLSCFEIDLHLI